MVLTCKLRIDPRRVASDSIHVYIAKIEWFATANSVDLPCRANSIICFRQSLRISESGQIATVSFQERKSHTKNANVISDSSQMQR
jgi:hypothetical protein